MGWYKRHLDAHLSYSKDLVESPGSEVVAKGHV